MSSLCKPWQLGEAIALAAQLFAGKLDKAGQPYILHCLRVMNAMGEDLDAQVVAVLHDVAEDCEGWTTTDLQLQLDLPAGIVLVLSVLQHWKEVPYEDYIKGISHFPLAVKVKLADLKDNSDITRLKGLRQKDFERMEKYHRAYVYLKN